MKMNRVLLSVLLVLIITILSACRNNDDVIDITSFKDWDQVLELGRNKEVNILMWGGNESINQFMDTYVSDNVMELYGIKLVRTPMNAPEFLTKLINEKKANQNIGTADLLWINAENFLTAKEGGLLDGPFTDLLPNLNTYYDLDASDLNYDSGIPIEGYEGIWGRAQLVFSYDEAVLTNPPKTYEELKTWVIANPGKFTYPRLPDDFVGAAFVRNAFYELTGESNMFQTEASEAERITLSQDVKDYFKSLNPYLWNQGASFPATQAQLDALFKNGEVELTMGFEIGKTAGLIESGVYPSTVKSYVFDSGTIGNSHYLAIPFNSPEKAAALLVMDFLQSPKAQIEKMKASVWGDMPAFDVSLLTEAQQLELSAIQSVSGMISLDELTSKRLPEMNALWIAWIKELWVNDIAGKS